MTPQQIIRALETRGISQYRVARLLSEKGAAVSQSTINRIARGETDDPSYRVGIALASLLNEVSAAAPRKRRAAHA